MLREPAGNRLKYGYIGWNTPFKRLAEYYLPAVSPMNDAKITFGQQPNPLIDWEENLYGYRFTSLVPWNYLSLSSTGRRPGGFWACRQRGRRCSR